MPLGVPCWWVGCHRWGRR